MLVSRGWSGKTLSQHRADRAEVVRQALEAAGLPMAVADRMAADVVDDQGNNRFQWAAVVTNISTKADLLMATIIERRRWREEYERAKALAAANGPPVDSHSATVMDAARRRAEQ